MDINITKTRIHKNSTTVKTKNRRFLIIKPVKRDTLEMAENQNVIVIEALTSEVTEKPGCLHQLSANGKIKTTSIGLSDIALKELYYSLHQHFQHHPELQ